jgi:hypothetical protein
MDNGMPFVGSVSDHDRHLLSMKEALLIKSRIHRIHLFQLSATLSRAACRIHHLSHRLHSALGIPVNATRLLIFPVTYPWKVTRNILIP